MMMNDLKQRMLDACHGDWASNLSHIPRALADGVAEIDRITAERDGLRKALEKIYAGSEDDKPPFRAMDRQQMRAVARAALTPSVPDAGRGSAR